MKPTVCFDLDGTLAEYDGWKGGEIGFPIKSGVSLLKHFWEEGWRILIQSCRTNHQFGQIEEQHQAIRLWLNRNQIPYDEIVTEGKAVADIYFCDRTVTFRSNEDWEALYADAICLYRRIGATLR